MHALKLNATIDSTRRLLLELPAETPEGEAEVIVLVADDAPARFDEIRAKDPNRALSRCLRQSIRCLANG